jgi:hypothetical protein
MKTTILGLIVAVLVSTRAYSQIAVPCADYEAIKTQLETQFGEIPTQIGVTAEGQLIILFINESNRSWTIVFSLADGKACPAFGGNSWGKVEAPKPKVKWSL